MSLISVIYLVVCASCTTKSTPPIEFMTFKYGSTHHMHPPERIVKVQATPNEVVQTLHDELRRAGAKNVIVNNSSQRVFASDQDNKNWRTLRDTARAEWEAYRLGDALQYQSINRTSDPKVDVRIESDSRINGQIVTADVWFRGAEFSRSKVSSGLGFQANTFTTETRKWLKHKPLASRITFLIWPEDVVSTTSIYCTAVPLANGVEPSNETTLPIEWLPYVKGKDEARLVRSYLDILRHRLGLATE